MEYKPPSTSGSGGLYSIIPRWPWYNSYLTQATLTFMALTIRWIHQSKYQVAIFEIRNQSRWRSQTF